MFTYMVYDCAIIKAIPNPKVVQSGKIEYCKGWDDIEGMGISCIGARIVNVNNTEYEFYDTAFVDDSLVDELDGQLDNFEAFDLCLENVHCIVGFNNNHFDDKLLNANGYKIPFGVINYDILAEIWEGAGLSRTFEYPSHTGFSLDAICSANGIGKKTGTGELAPILWQNNKKNEVISYCKNDVKLTDALFRLIQQKGEIIDPRQFNDKFKYYNPNFEFKPIKVKTISDILGLKDIGETK